MICGHVSFHVSTIQHVMDVPGRGRSRRGVSPPSVTGARETVRHQCRNTSVSRSVLEARDDLPFPRRVLLNVGWIQNVPVRSGHANREAEGQKRDADAETEATRKIWKQRRRRRRERETGCFCNIGRMELIVCASVEFRRGSNWGLERPSGSRQLLCPASTHIPGTTASV